MKKLKVLTILLISLSFYGIMNCQSGQTTEPPQNPVEEQKNERSMNLILDEVNKKLNFTYQPYGKGWAYKNVTLDANDFNKWFNPLKTDFSKIFENLDPSIKIQVVGHTCSIGPREAQPDGRKGNIWYSTERAKGVYDALIKQGIPADRIEYKGIADDEPIAGIDTKDQKNRRVTFRAVLAQ